MPGTEPSTWHPDVPASQGPLLVCLESQGPGLGSRSGLTWAKSLSLSGPRFPRLDNGSVDPVSLSS